MARAVQFAPKEHAPVKTTPAPAPAPQRLENHQGPEWMRNRFSSVPFPARSAGAAVAEPPLIEDRLPVDGSFTRRSIAAYLTSGDVDGLPEPWPVVAVHEIGQPQNISRAAEDG